jgi:aminoglycoside phosphotransferase (APT) family kinase protein
MREPRFFGALDIEQPGQLVAYLRASGRMGVGEEAEVRVLAGGVSNRTVLVKRSNGEAWVLKQALEKLRVAVEWHSDPRRIEREALGMRRLASLAPPGSIPALLFEDARHHLLAMAAVPEPHENWKTPLLRGQLERQHVEQFGRLLGAIHRGSHERREELAPLFEERGFFESLRLEPYYLYSAERVPAAAPFLHALVAETRATRQALVHGDYSPKNILVHFGRLVLLDHEVIHWGDPAFDLGFSLAHFLSKAHHLRAHRAAFADAAGEYWGAYRRELGEVPWSAELEVRVVRHALGCLLARVAGRSPMEYLDATERARQGEVVLDLMADAPDELAKLTNAFLQRIEHKEEHGSH